MKTVCIVGAGPAGLVGAKTLLKTGAFRVTVFEKADRIGGIWAHGRESADGFLSPETPTNLSKFSVGFSDFSWDSLELPDEAKSQSANLAHEDISIPMFPKAWQVQRYLEAYGKKYIPEGSIHLNKEVLKADRMSGAASESRWRITSRTASSKVETEEFDFLMLGSGFFSKPRSVEHGLMVDQDLHASVVHSSQFKRLSDLFPDPENANGKCILVLGGGNSAGEAAATIAQQLSDAQYSPATGRKHLYRGCKIIHVTPRPLYALPPYAPVDDSSHTFLPIDFKLYDFSKRPLGPVVSGGGQVNQQVKDMIHRGLQAIVGSDQSDLGSAALVIPPCEPRSAVQVALSESYSEFVRSGAIEVISGRVSGLRNGPEGAVIADFVNSSSAGKVTPIGAVVMATGYSPASAIDFLSEEVKNALHHDPQSVRLPLVLQGWQTMTETIPDLSLLGFYEGPYWGIMEMQARLTAHRWLTDCQLGNRTFETTDRLLGLRAAMKARELDVPQYWFGDYLGYMDEIATYLKLQRNDGLFGEREGPMAPARYLSTESDKSEADLTMKDLHSVWNACLVEGRGVARATFRGLQGDWSITRTIDSALPSFPSGTLEGTASFHPRFPTYDKSDTTFDFEYLYIESGTLTLSNGASMPASRRYVYRYSEARDELSVWFVKPDNDLEVDYLFHNLIFGTPEEAKKAGACVAKADHLCVADMYWTEYKMPMQGISLPEFSTCHRVKGPSKDYEATTRYVRPKQKSDRSSSSYQI